MSLRPSMAALALAGVLATAALSPVAVQAADVAFDHDVSAALQALVATTPAAQALAPSARAILVFPNIVKAGFLVGAQYGEGALLVNGTPTASYRIVAASYGLQAGVQSFGYALFFMTPSALEHLDRTAGFEVGVGPSVVVVDQGLARTLTTTTARDDVYAFVFDQRGLMAGAGLQGSKITRTRR